MMQTISRRAKAKGFGRAFRSVLMLMLLLPLMSVAPASQVNAGVQPELLAVALSRPESMVSVIVQKTAKDGAVENAIKSLGGTVTRDLYFINALSADLPAKQLGTLASTPGIRWISLDGPVVSSQTKSTGSTTTPSFTTWATDIVVNNTSTVANTFNAGPLTQGKYLWVSGVLKVSGLGASKVTVNFDNSNILVTSSYGVNFNLPMPDGAVVYDPAATTATTTWDAPNGKWVTTVPSRLGTGYVFLSGLASRLPVTLPGSIGPLNWTGRFTSDTPGVTVSSWTWGAALYNNLDTSPDKLGVKPTDDATASAYKNADKAGTPENFKSAGVVVGGTGTGGTDYTGISGAPASITPGNTFVDADNMVDAPKGPNNTYGRGGNVSATFTGFSREMKAGTKISKVEAVVKAYVPVALSGTDTVRLAVGVGGTTVSNPTIAQATLNSKVGQAAAGLIYVDVTGSRAWLWSDFENGLNVAVTHSGFAAGHQVYYDAVGFRITTVAGTDNSGGVAPTTLTKNLIDPYKLDNAYNNAVGASRVWNEYPNYFQGQGMTVAVVDSGVVANRDLGNRLLNGVNFNKEYHDSVDAYGHGTFVAGIIAGDGTLSSGKYVGIAPKTNILNVRVSNDQGGASESDVVASLQWILENKARYNIRAVNMSLNSSTPQSYNTSPMNAAVEILWFNGIVVVVSAGNNGTANLFPPANDPFVITVGATDDKDTPSLADDTRASYSAYGKTEAGTVKPELVAPGTNIIALLPQNGELRIGKDHGANKVNLNYFRMSGTSMSAPMVSGAVALLLQANPNLTPDQVKYRLMSTAVKGDRWPGYDPNTTGAGYLDIYAAVKGISTESANTGLKASQLLWSGSNPVTWNSVNWNSVNWNTVNWNSVNWNSVNWNSVNWNSDYWGQ